GAHCLVTGAVADPVAALAAARAAGFARPAAGRAVLRRYRAPDSDNTASETPAAARPGEDSDCPNIAAGKPAEARGPGPIADPPGPIRRGAAPRLGPTARTH